MQGIENKICTSNFASSKTFKVHLYQELNIPRDHLSLPTFLINIDIKHTNYCNINESNFNDGFSAKFKAGSFLSKIL